MVNEIKNDTKVCSICDKEKSLNDFYTQKKYSKKRGEYIYYPPECKECTKERSLKRQLENNEEYKKYQKEWRKKNKHMYKIYNKKFQVDQKEEYILYMKEWRQNNKEIMNEHGKRYREEKMFKISTKQWKACKEYFNNCCVYCGITQKESKKLYNKSLNKEHAINKGENDLSNCLPSCTSCNSQKHDKDYIEWYTPENEIYNEDRWQLIEQWLNVDYKKYIN